MDKEGINIVVVADGPHKGMKMYGPRLLIKYKNISVLDYMMMGFNKIFPRYDIYVVSTFKIKKTGIKTVSRGMLVNDCINLIRQFRYCNTLFIFEDTIPNQHSLKSIKDTEQSSMVFDSHNELNKHDLGGVIHGNGVQHLSYGLEVKANSIQRWSNILYLNQGGAELLDKAVNHPSNQYMLNFEIINWIIDGGHLIQAIHGKKIKTLNITTPSDITKIRYII